MFNSYPFLSPFLTLFCCTASATRGDCLPRLHMLSLRSAVLTISTPSSLKIDFVSLGSTLSLHRKFWELQGLFMNWINLKMSLSLFYFSKIFPHGQFNFRFYLLLPVIIEARGHSVNDEKGTAKGENSLWVWSKTHEDSTHVPKVPDHASRSTGHEYDVEEVEKREGEREMWKYQKGVFPSEKYLWQ